VCPLRARWLERGLGALTDLVGDEPVTVGGAVLVDQRGAGRGVAHAVHQFAEGRARLTGQRVAGMAKVVEVEAGQASRRKSTWSAPQRGGVIVRLVGVTVVGLGAWSELARKDEQGMDIDVHEFAVLDDGRRLTLHQDRGFSTSATHMTADHAESSVLTTVLPDDAEFTGEDHPWEWLASLIRNHGVAVTPEQLKAVRYVVEFGPRLAALLESEGQQER
jgi:hypothetical protein